jgi:hypothetical protein
MPSELTSGTKAKCIPFNASKVNPKLTLIPPALFPLSLVNFPVLSVMVRYVIVKEIQGQWVTQDRS